MATIDVISANVPILRELHNRIGQLELAERVGVSRRTDLMGRIAKELGVTVSVLTESKLQAVTVALPADVCQRLSSAEGPETLEAMIRAARHPCHR